VWQTGSYSNDTDTSKVAKLALKSAQNSLVSDHWYIVSRVRPIPVSGISRYGTRQYWSVSVSADTYLSIGADTSSPVVHLPVSTVNTVAMHTYSFKPTPYFHAYTPHTYITCAHLYSTQNRIFSTKICTA